MQCRHRNFHLTRRQILVDRLRRARHHFTRDGHHRFILQLAQAIEQPTRRIRHNLRNPVMVAQIQKRQLPMVAHPVHPAGEADFLARIRGAKFIASMRTVGVHGCNPYVLLGVVYRSPYKMQKKCAHKSLRPYQRML